MNKYLKMILFGLLTWIVPFIASFFFFNIQTQELMVEEMFFKSIMIVLSGLTGMILLIYFFKEIDYDFLKEGISIGIIWLIINCGLDIALVQTGFFQMTLYEWFTQIGLRYLMIPIMSIGAGKLLQK